MEYKLVVYSHTDFIDILSLQDGGDVLLINYNDLDLDIYSRYNQIILYDDSLPYASRLLNLLNIESKYILLLHDIDIIIHKNNSVIDKITNLMEVNNIDRVDLQFDCNPPNTVNWDLPCLDLDGNTKYRNEDYDDLISPNEYGTKYNVNPSLWNLKSLISVMSQFKYLSYRNIEVNRDLQSFVNLMNVYQLYSKNIVRCGYFTCLNFFQFLHITHGGLLIPVSKDDQDHSLSDHVYEFYMQALKRINSNRRFRNRMSD